MNLQWKKRFHTSNVKGKQVEQPTPNTHLLILKGACKHEFGKRPLLYSIKRVERAIEFSRNLETE